MEKLKEAYDSKSGDDYNLDDYGDFNLGKTASGKTGKSVGPRNK